MMCIVNAVYPLLGLSDYFDYIYNHDALFTIVMPMLARHNHDNYSGFKDP